MAGFSFSVMGSEAVLSKLSAFEIALQADVQKTLEEAGQMGKSLAEERAPVLTGFMRDSMYLEVERGKVTIGNSAPYSGFVEEGHHSRSGSWVAPQPFLGPSGLEAGYWLRSELAGIANTTISRV